MIKDNQNLFVLLNSLNDFKQNKTEFSELKQMLAEKWKTKVERIELRLENRDIEPRPSSHGELMPGNSGLNPEKVEI